MIRQRTGAKIRSTGRTFLFGFVLAPAIRSDCSEHVELDYRRSLSKMHHISARGNHASQHAWIFVPPPNAGMCRCLTSGPSAVRKSVLQPKDVAFGNFELSAIIILILRLEHGQANNNVAGKTTLEDLVMMTEPDSCFYRERLEYTPKVRGSSWHIFVCN